MLLVLNGQHGIVFDIHFVKATIYVLSERCERWPNPVAVSMKFGLFPSLSRKKKNGHAERAWNSQAT